MKSVEEPPIAKAYDQDWQIASQAELERVGLAAEYGTISCPVSDCVGKLGITWIGTMVLDGKNTIEELQQPSSAHSRSWRIGCTDGHELLLPTSHATDYEDFQQECSSCHPDEGASGDVVYHHDWLRLRRLLGLGEARDES